MKTKILSLFIFIVFSKTASSQKKLDVSFPLDGFTRELIVSVPTTAAPPNGYPVVVMLHGSTGDKNTFYDKEGWKELGQSENFITVFPSSLRWCVIEDDQRKHITKFVNGSLLEEICPEEIPNLISDVKFLKQLVQKLSDTLSIDTSMIFGTGFSNGGAMMHKISIDAGNVFKAVSTSGAALSTLDSAKPINRIPVWLMVGTLDGFFLTPPHTSLPWGEDSILIHLRKLLRRSLMCQGLTESFTRLEGNNRKTYIFSECQSGLDCAPFVFTLIKDMGHLYPNGSNNAVDAPSLFWDFFNNPPSVHTAGISNSMVKPHVYCYPNPSHDKMVVSTGLYSHLKKIFLYDMKGKLLMETCTESSSFTLDKSTIGEGMFYLRVESESGILVKKLIFL